MKKLYDEIMEMPIMNILKHDIKYVNGHNTAKRQAAELAKKYDDEIERLSKELYELKDFLDFHGKLKK
jgi:hypothetical protein